MIKDITQLRDSEIERLGLYRKFGRESYMLEKVGTDKKQLLKVCKEKYSNRKYRITPITFYWKDKSVKGYALRTYRKRY